jgi:hypothetical protein
MTRERSLTKDYKKDKKYCKKKPYGEANVGQEWNSNDENSKSESDEVATMTIKGKISSSKSLFPKLSKQFYLFSTFQITIKHPQVK